jgi:hypothetical protein
MTGAVEQRRPPAEEPVREPKRLATHVVAVIGPPAATGRKFTVRRSDVHSPHENRYLAVFHMAGKSG